MNRPTKNVIIGVLAVVTSVGGYTARHRSSTADQATATGTAAGTTTSAEASPSYQPPTSTVS